MITKGHENIKLYIPLLFLLLGYVYFTSMSNYILKTITSEIILLLVIAILLVLNYLIYQYKNTIWFSRQQMSWVLVLLFSIFTNSFGYIRVYSYFLIMMMVVLLLTNNMDWFYFSVQMMLLFSYIHGLATVILFAFPNLYQYVTPYINFRQTMSGYKSGLTNHYSYNGMYLAFGCIICWCRIFTTKHKRILRVIMALIMSTALVLTTKRAHIVFSALTIIFTYTYIQKRRSTRFIKLLWVCILVLLTFYMGIQFIPELRVVVDRFINPDGGDITTGRIPLYILAWEMFLEKPLFGWGWGSYRYNFVLRSIWQNNTTEAHNVFLQILAEGGVTLFFLFLFVVISTLRQTMLQFQKIKEEENPLSSYLVISIGIQVFFIMYCMTGNPLYDIQCQIPYALSCAMSYAVAFEEHKKILENKSLRTDKLQYSALK